MHNEYVICFNFSNRYMKKSLFVLFSSFFTQANFAQSTIQGDLNVSLAVPIIENKLEDGNNLIAFGIGGGFNAQLGNSPFYSGLNFRYMWLGGDSRTLDFIDDDGFYYELKSKVSGAMSALHLNIRIDIIQYTEFPVTPYIGGFIGGRFLGAKTKIDIDYEDGSDPINLERNSDWSTTSSYGFEIGLHIRVEDNLFIDIRYEHAYGGWAEYIDLESIEINDQGDASFSKLNTRTDISLFTLGVTGVF